MTWSYLGIGAKGKRFIILKKIFILLVGIISITILYLYTFQLDTSSKYPEINANYLNAADSTKATRLSEVVSNKSLRNRGFLIDTPGCRIPNLPVTTPKYASFFKTKLSDPKCEQQWSPLVGKSRQRGPPLVESNLTALWVVASSLRHYNINNITQLFCCYRPFVRSNPHTEKNVKKITDNLTRFLPNCLPIFRDKPTPLIGDVEFVRVECKKKTNSPNDVKIQNIYRDFHAFVPYKKHVEERCSPQANKTDELWSVLVLGIDAMSRLNMQRQLPRTHALLSKSAEVLLGYNKVGDNTLPNLLPLLTGMTYKEIISTCWNITRGTVDACPFIWKRFASSGFRTAYGEDSTSMSTFNYNKKGFLKQPTDYYIRPFLHESLKQQGYKQVSNLKLCTGPRQTITMVLDYAKKFTMRFANQRFFSLLWMNSVSHNDLNMPHIADTLIEKTLHALKANGTLNRTVLMFLSDHGMRFGKFRETLQGRVEERLPAAYISLPESFKKRFPVASVHVQENARNRLVTPFDIYETLLDLLDPHERLLKFNKNINARGVSLFSPISPNRTCQVANISSHWCTCEVAKPVSTKLPIVQKIVHFVIAKINSQVKSLTACETLKLAKIKYAEQQVSGISTNKVASGVDYYLVMFQTNPGGAVFEATVKQTIEKNTSQMELITSASRLTSYGNQGNCIKDPVKKMYCYCKNNTKQ